MKKKIELILLVVIFLLAIFLRFYKLTEIPNGFNQDESSIGYNAYSILQTGKDEYGRQFPIYFESFGDQKLPVYIYLTSLSERAFGLNEFAVRFPSALLGSLSVLMLFFVVRLVSDKKGLALLTAFFLAINPWHLFFSRAAFEDNVALAFALFGVWMFLQAAKSKKWSYFFFSILGFALSVYSYNVTRLLAPVLLGGLIWMYWSTVKKVQKKFILSLTIFSLILLLPFILTFFSSAGAMSAHGALITSTDIQAKGLEMRSYLAGGPGDIIGKIFFNKYIYFIWQYIQNLVGVLSIPYFFISGSLHGNQGIGNVGTFYLVELPLILIGGIWIVKKKIKNLYFFLFWTICVWLILSLSKEVPHTTRGYFFVIPFEVFAALGLLVLKEKITTIHSKNIRRLLVIGILIVSAYNLVYYFTSYYVRFPVFFASKWREQDKPLALYLKEHESKYNKIIIDNKASFIYSSVLFFDGYSPQQFQHTVKRKPEDTEGYSYMESFGKYEWKDVDWVKDLHTSKVLIVTVPDALPSSAGVLKTFYYPSRPVVLSVTEQIAQYPFQEKAYVLVETH